MPPDLCFRQMLAESAGNPKAVSPAGARGLFQLMHPAMQDVGVQDPLDPDQNVRGGTEYLARQVASVRLALDTTPVSQDDIFRMALAAYNCGFGYIKVAIKETRARGLPLTWPSLAQILPSVTVRGLKPDTKQVFAYVEKILPAHPA